MNQSKRSNRGTSWTFIVAILIVSICFAGPGYAQPHTQRHRARYPAPGRIVPKMPFGRTIVNVGPDRYYFNTGVFYRKGPRGYAVVRAPIGAVVMHLPVGYHTLVVAGVTYFLFADVYYRKAPSGYVVVGAPAAEMVPSPILEQVEVTAKRRNVRSGPGVNHPAIGSVIQGTVLSVQGNAPGWHYVMLPDGRYGWVMAVYTRAMTVDGNAEG